MSTAATPFLRRLAPFLLAIGAVLAAANWYLQPERVRSWVAALSLLVVMALALGLVLRRRSSSPVRLQAAGSIQDAVSFGGAIMAATLGAKLAYALGAIQDPGLSQRLAMVFLGAFLVFTGNAQPKMLTPLPALRCDPARAQALQRFSAWTQVLTGLAFMFVWVALPADTAKPVSVALLAGGALAVAGTALRQWARRGHA
jgi:hypothetical protein